MRNLSLLLLPIVVLVSCQVQKPASLEQAASSSSSNPKAMQTSFCTQKPREMETGRDVYPIDEKKYGDIGYLGELFTADDCDNDRIHLIFGVNKDLYELQPDIGLHADPSPDLLRVLQNIGFELGSTCSQDNRTKCTHWTLKRTIPLSVILQLKPFAREIKSSGCLNCG